MECLVNKFFVVTNPKKNFMAHKTYWNEVNLLLFFLLYRVAFSVATVENLFFLFFIMNYFFINLR